MDSEYQQILDELLAHPTDEAIGERLHARYLELQRGGTTSLGLPYPSPTDPLAEGADAIRALAEAITFSRIVGGTAVPIANGGTGATTPAAARAALGVAATSHTHDASDTVSGQFLAARIPHISYSSSTTRIYLGTVAANPGSDEGSCLFVSDTEDNALVVRRRGAAILQVNAAGLINVGSIPWASVTGTPSTFTPSSHNHSASDITSGTLPIARGGTGATSAAAARSSLGAAAASHTHAIGDTTGTLPLNRGGTGATTAAAARSALGAAAASHTHAIGDTTGTLPVNRGGTGATSAAAARSALGITLGNLGAAAASHTHPHTQITGLSLSLATTQAGGFTSAVWNRNLTGTRRSAWITNDGGAPTELGHTSSSERFKQDIVPLPEVTDEQVTQLTPVAFHYIDQVKRHGDKAPWDFGLIAERLIDAGLEWAVFYDDDGQVEGIHYERAWLALLPPLHRLIADRDELAARLDQLETRLDALEAKDTP